jgi:hypothetical protein
MHAWTRKSASDLSDRRRTDGVSSNPSWQRKLIRAEEHFNLFLAEFREHAARYPYGIAVKRYPDPRLLTIHLNVERFPDTERWSLIIGDSIHNLRSTLDHLVYTIASNVSGINPPPDSNRLSYPMRRADFWHLGVLQQNGPFMAELQGLQPDTRPEWKGLRLLTVLEELDNLDKHRTLNVMVAAPQSMVFSFAHLGTTTAYHPSYDNITTNFSPLEPDAELIRIVEPEPIPDVEVHWQQTVVPLISHAPANDGRDRTGAIDLLQALIAEVVFVMTTLQPFL